jgi:TonB-dependent receptor
MRIFRDLEERSLNVGADLSFPFRAWRGLAGRLKAGGSYLGVARDFGERRFEYREGRGVSYPAFGGDAAAYFRRTGLLEDASSEGRYTFGNYIIETSPLKNNYTGEQTVAAGYAMVDLGVTGALRVIGGARFETTRMETASADTSLPRGLLGNRDWLPSVNAVYTLGENMNLRAAYTRTLARPTFRELAPYATFDFVGDFVFEGHSGLRRTLIRNYDLRWEWFVRRGEILAASVFYKGFRHPIERVILTSVGNNTLSVQNVDRARVYGLELEARKRLDDVAGFLAPFQVGGNFSLVRSRVDIPWEELGVILAADPGARTSRPLQGQSPYLVNLDVSYDHPRPGTTLGLYYNLFGERLATVSEGAAPDVFERARTTLDLVAAQRLPGGFTARFSAKNLFDDPVLFSQRFKGREFVYSRYRLGRTFTFGVSYTVD